ncbi:putative reverse transcriptase domain-containing protein [Tanacetum coccineum]
MVYYNTSHNGLGTIIRQKEKVIAYNSLQLKVHEKNYTTPDLEFRETMLTLKIWEHYRYDMSMNSNQIIIGIRSKDLGTQSCLTTQQNLKASLELPDLILNAIFHHLSHKLSLELLPFVDFYSGDIVSRNVLTLHIPSSSVMVVVVMFAVVGSVSSSNSYNLIH